MDILSKEVLPDGRSCEVLRIVTPDPEVPEELIRYFIASFGFDTYRKAVQDLTYWRLYFRESLAGHFAPEVIDFYYVLRVEGAFAGRIWFAFNTRTGHGNFGNVYTEPAFRRCGVMNILMKHCMAGFQASPAIQLCCASGNKFAVQSYLKHGFKLIFGGEAGPLCLRKNGTFQEAEKQAFPGHEPCTVRPGTIGDQFECDKFLYYTSAWKNFSQKSFGLAATIVDYRIAWQEKLSGAGAVNVLSTPSGTVCAYAYALKICGENILDFRFHPDYPEHLPELVKRTAEDYEQLFQASPICASAEEAELKTDVLRRAGFKPVGGLDGVYRMFQPEM